MMLIQQILRFSQIIANLKKTIHDTIGHNSKFISGKQPSSANLSFAAAWAMSFLQISQQRPPNRPPESGSTKR